MTPMHATPSIALSEIHLSSSPPYSESYLRSDNASHPLKLFELVTGALLIIPIPISSRNFH